MLTVLLCICHRKKLNSCSFLIRLKNIGTLSVQELFFQLIGWLGVELGVSPVGMVYFMG